MEIPLSGTFLLTEYFEDLNEIYTNNKDAVYFETKKEERVILQFQDGRVRLNVLHIGKLSFFSSDATIKLGFLKKRGSWNRTKRSALLKAQEYVKSLILTYTERNKSTCRAYQTNDEFINNLFH